MEPKRRQRIELAVLAVLVAGAAAYYAWPSPAGGSAPRVATAQRGRAATSGTRQVAPDVHLEVLNAERPRPVGVSRDLFSFKPKAAPAPPPPPPAPVLPRPAPAAPAAPAGPPPLAPIPLKFAALLSQGPVKIAVLIDGLGHAIYGKEGETVEGRYKILRISAESIDMSYLDGRGRQTIRMNGT